ncbi:hypothetical protein M441DRAFT_145221 [Trichoderma asperellum CBS 433.97]|uniref:Uncharacterized protein n=4 Tax=Trichoderma asperellum TaxID=101201 RepID=A0A2T3Z2M0_TRIA4|nr:hypothetical protein M441DRAFT_145221 [Trichoderma asperellum CBS 433.97]PTB39045.1 hypothetical protein M441DRAFT_145221 [Trichoderma asperellum CBS 433.97]
MLIDKGANVNSNNGVSSPLSLASGRGHSRIVRLLLRAGASPEFITPGKITPLFLAAISNSSSAAAAVEALLNHGANIQATDEDGKTVLSYTLRQQGRLRIFDLLVSRGANLDVRDNLGRTLLMEAAASGQSLCIELLIQSGLDVNDRDNSGMTALHHAVMNDAVDSILPLLRRGADPEAKDHHGLSVFERARWQGNTDILIGAERELESRRF